MIRYLIQNPIQNLIWNLIRNLIRNLIQNLIIPEESWLNLGLCQPDTTNSSSQDGSARLTSHLPLSPAQLGFPVLLISERLRASRALLCSQAAASSSQTLQGLKSVLEQYCWNESQLALEPLIPASFWIWIYECWFECVYSKDKFMAEPSCPIMQLHE